MVSVEVKVNVISKSNHNNEHYLLLQSSLSHFFIAMISFLLLLPLPTRAIFAQSCFKALFTLKAKKKRFRGEFHHRFFFLWACKSVVI